MRKWFYALCLLISALIIALLPHARLLLPMDTHPLVEEKYAGWSGVLRLWVCETWQSGTGSLAVWLNRCISAFEKRHNGVYVQAQYVDADTVASMNDDGILPPDMLLFPPGLLTDAEGLSALNLPENLRPSLAGSGLCDGALYAIPIALGGYLWARNTFLIDRVPETWLAEETTLTAPTPVSGHRWDAALISLCSGPAANTDETQVPEGTLESLDLGLSTEDTPVPVPSQTLSPPPSASPCQLPPDFQFEDDAWRRFINGEAAVMPVSQREIRKLQALSEQGKGPDWKLERGINAFTDQLMSLAIVEHPDGGVRLDLCTEFMDFLLSEYCQGTLNQAAAFSVTDAASGYNASDPLVLMETSLRTPSLRVPNSFDTRWSSMAEGIIRKCISESEDTRQLWAEFCKYLC